VVILIPAIIGRQLRPPFGWESDVFERNGWRWIGGSCLLSLEQQFEYDGTRAGEYAFTTRKYPLQLPKVEDLDRGFIWLHHHQSPSQVWRFANKLKVILSLDIYAFLVIATLPSRQTEEMLWVFKRTFPQSYIIYAPCLNFSKTAVCHTPSRFGLWYSRDRERRIMNQLADAVVFVKLAGFEEDIHADYKPKAGVMDDTEVDTIVEAVGRQKFRRLQVISPAGYYETVRALARLHDEGFGESAEQWLKEKGQKNG